MKRTGDGFDSFRVRKIVRKLAALFIGILICILMTLLSGCVSGADEGKKLKDLEYTILKEEMIPPEMDALIRERKEKAFFLTYADQGWLYICRGYGKRETAGCYVEVDRLYETENAVCIHTCLMGPEKGEEIKEKETCPYLVVKLKYIDKEVVFE